MAANRTRQAAIDAVQMVTIIVLLYRATGLRLLLQHSLEMP